MTETRFKRNSDYHRKSPTFAGVKRVGAGMDDLVDLSPLVSLGSVYIATSFMSI
jgi:hypothetical protein